MAPYDYRTVAAEIIAVLNAHEMQHWSQKLADAILQSHNETDAVLTLRNSLFDLRDTNMVPADIAGKVDTLIVELTRMIDFK